MTVKEALIAELPVTVPDNMLTKALLDNEVTGASTYTKDDAESIDYCVITLLKRLLSEPDITEGGYSIKFDRSAVQARLSSLLSTYGLAPGPTVTSKSVW